MVVLARWVLFPPVLSAVLLGIAAVFRSRDAAFAIPAIVWGVIIAAYVCICGVSMMHILRRDMRYITGISMLAQGLILSTVSIHIGAYALSWLGLLLFLAGLGLSFSYATSAHSELDAIPSVSGIEGDVGESADEVLSKLGLPVCYTDSGGDIEEATVSFLEAVEKKAEDIFGESVGSVLSPDEDGEVELPSGRWWMKFFNSGNRRYYSLSPTKDGKPPKEEPKKVDRSGAAAITDPTTGLYTEQYRDIRAPEEIARAQKYKRPLSSILVELAFDANSSALPLSNDQVDMIKAAFAQKVKEVLRETDCGFWMDGRSQILLMLPETQQAAAKSLISRLLLLPQDVFDDDIRSVVDPKVTAGMFFCNGSGSAIDYGVFMASIEQAFANARDGQVSNAA